MKVLDWLNQGLQRSSLFHTADFFFIERNDPSIHGNKRKVTRIKVPKREEFNNRNHLNTEVVISAVQSKQYTWSVP